MNYELYCFYKKEKEKRIKREENETWRKPTMYEYIEAIKDEMQMIDVRSLNHKFYKTFRIPACIRSIIKKYITKKCLKSLKKHLNSKPLLNYDYVKDLSNFINTGIQTKYMNLYRLRKTDTFIYSMITNPELKVSLKYVRVIDDKEVKYMLDFYKNGEIQLLTISPSERDGEINKYHTDYYTDFLPVEVAEPILDMIYIYTSYYLSLSCMETKHL